MAANKKMTKQEILKQIKLEEAKIKEAEDRKNSYVFEPKNQITVMKSSNAPKSRSKSNSSQKKSSGSKKASSVTTKPKTTPKNTKHKDEEKTTWTYVSPFDDKKDQVESKPAATQAETKSQEQVGKLFYCLSIVAGLVLIAIIVIVMIGISSNWTFWM